MNEKPTSARIGQPVRRREDLRLVTAPVGFRHPGLCEKGASVRSFCGVRDRQTCVGCGKKSPETETNYTLISAQFGWRLTRYKSNEGTLVVEWRCPTCWRDYKRAKAVVADEPASSRPSQIAPPSQPPGPAAIPKPPAPFETFRGRTTPGNGTKRPASPTSPSPQRAVPPVPPPSGPHRTTPRPPPRGTR